MEDSMSATDWMVIVAGLGLIGWVNWYFFVAAGRRADRRERKEHDRASRS